MNYRKSGGDKKLFRRIGLISLGAHLCFGVGLARVDLQPLMVPGVWAVEEPVIVEITLPEILPATIEPVVRPSRPLPPIPAGGEQGVQGKKAPEGKKSGGGGGDPLERVTRMGVLGRLNGKGGGTRVAAESGGVAYASDGIDQLLRGVGERRKVSGAASSGESGIGFGNGVSSGFGGGIAKQRARDLVASLGDGSNDQLVLEREKGAIDGAELLFEGVEGCREEADIARIVLSHKGGIRGCYNRALLRSPDDEGEVAVRFVISTRGTITDAEVISSTVQDPALEECVLERIGRWVFPPEPGCETVVRYSFHFTSDR